MNVKKIISQLINRKRIYSVRDYVRTVNSELQTYLTESEIMFVFNQMVSDLEMVFGITVNNKVYGFTY